MQTKDEFSCLRNCIGLLALQSQYHKSRISKEKLICNTGVSQMNVLYSCRCENLSKSENSTSHCTESSARNTSNHSVRSF